MDTSIRRAHAASFSRNFSLAATPARAAAIEFLRRRKRAAAGLFGLALMLAAAPGLAAQDLGAMTALPDSIREVAPLGTNPRSRPVPAVVTRQNLSGDEAGATMEIEVTLKMRDLAGLQRRVDGHEIISPAEMAQRYFPLAADAERIAAWLTAQGLKVTRPDPLHLGVFAEGTVGQLSAAFHVAFARVASEGTEFTSAITAPSIPAALVPAVIGINGLQPHLRMHPHLVRRAAHPDATATTVPTTPTPAQLRSIYNVPALTGAGQTIAILDDQFPAYADLIQFWLLYGINQSISSIAEVSVGRGPNPSADATEVSLDVEWASAMAPGANIRIYGVSSLSGVDQIISQLYNDATTTPGLCQLSLSFGSLESTLTLASIQSQVQDCLTLASAGISIFASSGDGGSNPQFNNSSGWTNLYPSGTLSPSYPASDVNVTGVGGTSLNLSAISAVSTETAWNDSGGAPSFFFLRPSWQTGAGIPAGSTRLSPDVAALGDPETGVTVIVDGEPEVFGGTSLSAPMWAGFGALINQARFSGSLPALGTLNSRIYPLLGSSCFWEITSGNNGGESAGPGYNLVTGLGVPNLTNLVTSLSGAGIPLPGAPVFVVRPGNQTATAGGAATIPTAVSGVAPVAYQWQRMPAGGTTWTNLADNGTYAGSATATLRIGTATAAMSGDQFQCVATNSLGQATGPITTLVTAFPVAVSTFAGTAGVTGFADGTGPSAQFDGPNGVAFDLLGNLYVADISNNTIRKITPAGVVTTLAGQAGVTGSADGVGTAAQFNTPDGIAIDSMGNLYVADHVNDTIRMVTPAGAVTTVAGFAGQSGTLDGTGSAARFSSPRAVEVDAAGNLYVSDGNAIRKIAPGGIVTTLAGTAGITGSADGQGTAAQFNGPRGLRLDSAGNLWVADLDNYTIRKVTMAGVVTTVAGLAGAEGAADGTGSAARLGGAYGLAFDPYGNLFFTDDAGDAIRMMTPAGTVSTLAGMSFNQGTANGSGEAARFSTPLGIAIDASDNLYVADSDYNTIRKGALASTPQISIAPQSQTVPTGGYLVLSVLGGGGSISYQWALNGVAIAGATGPTYTIPAVQAANAGAYTVTLSNSVGVVTSAPATVAVAPSATTPSRLGNLSTRSGVGTGNNIMIVGFVVGGTGTKQVLVRGIGPTLGEFGVTGVLANPQLELFNAAGVNVASDTTGWGGSAALTADFSQVYAFALPASSADEALLQTVPQGASTAEVIGANNTTGIALAEIYDFDGASAPARLINLSTRAFAGTGANALVAGFVISGATSETVLIRGIGPALGQAPFNISGVLAVPTLSLYNSSGTIIASNTGWGGTTALTNAFGAAYAFSLPANSADCALIATLPPGSYTAQVSGVNGSTGTALVEVYELP